MITKFYCITVTKSLNPTTKEVTSLQDDSLRQNVVCLILKIVSEAIQIINDTLKGVNDCY